MRRRRERRFVLALKREEGWLNERARRWNRLIDKAAGLLHLFPESDRERWRQTLEAARTKVGPLGPIK